MVGNCCLFNDDHSSSLYVEWGLITELQIGKAGESRDEAQTENYFFSLICFHMNLRNSRQEKFCVFILSIDLFANKLTDQRRSEANVPHSVLCRYKAVASVILKQFI